MEREAKEPGTHENISTQDVRELLGPSQMLYLVLDDATYTLRLTRNDRLILTK